MKTTQWLLLIFSGLVILNPVPIVYFNTFTHSLPHGIYVRIRGIPQRGDYAVTCLTPEIARYGMNRNYLAPGNCGTGTVRVLKIIEGIPGDHFVVKNGFLQLNRHLYPIMKKDSSGRKLDLFYKEKDGILEKGEYILLSDFVKNSWDSRYWGPVSIQFLLKPLWVFEKY